MNYAITDLDNCMLPVCYQAIIWTNNDLLSMGPWGRTNLNLNLNQNITIFIKHNVFESVIWKIATTLSQPKCINFIILFILVTP